MDKNDAVNWWKNLSPEDKLNYANNYYNTDDINSLTIKQIIDLSIYLKTED